MRWVAAQPFFRCCHLSRPRPGIGEFHAGVGQQTLEPVQQRLISSATGTPEGLTVTTTGTPFTLMPRESKTSPLSLRVGPNVVPGEYKITAQFAQTNVPSPSSGGVVYAPAIDANFKVIVSGDSGTVTVRAVAEGSDSLVSGDL